jgi:hypothetical protein
MTERFAAADLTLGQMNAIVKKLGGREAALKFLRGELAVSTPAHPTYTLDVDYDRKVEFLVQDGKYDWSNENLTSKNFPAHKQGKESIEAVLVHFNRDIGTDAALKELDQQGFRPPNIYELLAFGAKFPDVQREFPVVALGSVWQDSHGNRSVACLWLDGGGRRASLHWVGFDWDAVYRFLAVRK